MSHEEELAALAEGFRRIGRMARATAPIPAPPLKGPESFPALVDLGYLLDELPRDEGRYETRVGPLWRDPLISERTD